MAQSILIVKLSSMGDVVHTLPAAQALRRRFPEARLAWAVERAHAGVLRGQPFLDELIEWDRGTWRGLFDFLRRVRSRRWDIAVDFQGLFRSAMVVQASRAKRRIGFAPSRELAHWSYDERIAIPEGPLHAVEKSLRLVEALDAAWDLERAADADAGVRAQAQSRFPLPIGDAERRAVDRWCADVGLDLERERLAILNPHCRKPANIWPAERFAELAERLMARGVRVATCGGAASGPLCDRIAASVGIDLLRADGRFSLLESAEFIRRAAVFVTGDTGPMHLAAAVGTPIVALFGPADPAKTGPFASNATVLTKRLPCGPCFARRCPLGGDPPQCMVELSVDETSAAVLKRMEEGAVDDGADDGLATSAVFRRSA